VKRLRVELTEREAKALAFSAEQTFVGDQVDVEAVFGDDSEGKKDAAACRRALNKLWEVMYR
jgi:hypothetical protein